MTYMIKLENLRDILDELFSSKITDFAPNGLQVEGRENIASIATAVSSSLETIEAAIEKGVNALIVHHGLFWDRDSYVIERSKRKKLWLLLQKEISLFAYHLPLDMHPELGNNWKAAKDLGWSDLNPFCSLNGTFIGVKGKIPSCTREDLKLKLETFYQHSATCAWGGSEKIETVALVSGGAYKTIIEAAREGIDAFITGSFDEPVWYQAKEEGVNFFALGHSATERVGPIALANYLAKTLKIPCHFLDIHNPF